MRKCVGNIKEYNLYNIIISVNNGLETAEDSLNLALYPSPIKFFNIVEIQKSIINTNPGTKDATISISITNPTNSFL